MAGNNIGNGLMSIGAILFLFPCFLGLLILLISIIIGIFE